MTIKEYIVESIDNHEKEFGCYFSATYREVIYESIIKGIYAFNIIYDIQLRVYEIKYLDYKLCKHEDYLNPWCKDKIWSYDGGQRYQWSEMETLVFDSSVIRNIKLEEVLK
jgi:hypothetical protein